MRIDRFVPFICHIIAEPFAVAGLQASSFFCCCSLSLSLLRVELFDWLLKSEISWRKLIRQNYADYGYYWLSKTEPE